MPPPLRGRAPDILIVGITPNQTAPIAFADELEGAKAFARTFEYVPGGPIGHANLAYAFYYGALLQFVRRLDHSFGVWWQVEQGHSSLLVEFTDCLHTAARPGENLLDPHGPHNLVWEGCSGLLRREIEYLKPRCILGNGTLPSQMLWQILHPNGDPPALDRTHVHAADLGCTAHFSGFLPGIHLDRFARMRLLNELREHSLLWRRG